MPAPSERIVLKRLLAETDQLDRLRGLLQERPSEEVADRLRDASRRRLETIGAALRDLPERSVLGELKRRYRLPRDAFVVLLALLRRRLTHENPYLRGRELLALLFDDTYSRLRGTSLLDPSGVLLSAGLVVPDEREGEVSDPVDTPYKLSDRIYRAIRRAVGAQRERPPAALRPEPSAYRGNLEYVCDLRKLSLLYRKRASKIFEFDFWEDLGTGAQETVAALSERMERFRAFVAERLDRTPRAGDFPMRRLELDYGLDEEESVVLVTLLFNEVLEGSPFLDAVDLVKLVSTSEEDLLRRRRFLGRRSRLVRNQLVSLEEMVHDKELTAEVYLPNWVIDRMLGPGERGAIDTDVRLDFHHYLESLDSAEKFFEDLDRPQ